MAIIDGTQDAARAAAEAAQKAVEEAARRAAAAAGERGACGAPQVDPSRRAIASEPAIERLALQRRPTQNHSVNESFPEPESQALLARFFQNFATPAVSPPTGMEATGGPWEQDPVSLTPEQEEAIEARVTAAVGDAAAVSDPDRRTMMTERRELLIEAYRQAESTGDERLHREADELAQLYHDREVLALSRALGTSDTPRDLPPEGWHEATEAELRAYGLTPEDLRSNPNGDGFNADLYIPDPEIFGPDARPVLAFEGTDFGEADDVHADLAQALGREEAYYTQAMDIATRVHDATDGDVELTGHSLGGGLATAASLVTGAPAVVSNPAGVHPETVARFLDNRNLTAPGSGDAQVTTYVVDGDILTGLQSATNGLSEDNADGLATVFNGAVTVYNRVTGADLPTDASGVELRELPDAAGRVITLPAVDADGVARPELLSVEEIFDRVSRTADVLSLPGEVAERGGGLLGSILGGIGDAADWVLDTGGSILRGTGGFLEWADRYLPGEVASGLGRGLEILGDGYDDFGDVLENAADAAEQIARETGSSIAEVNRDLAIAAAGIIETLGATEVTWTRLPNGHVVPVPTGNEIVESVFEAIQRHDARTAYEAMDHQIGRQETVVRALLS